VIAEPAESARQPSGDGSDRSIPKPPQGERDGPKRQRRRQVAAARDLAALARLFEPLGGGFLGAIALEAGHRVT